MNGLPEHRERLSAYDIPQPHQRSSLRDQFAMAALATMRYTHEHEVALAEAAYRIADALMEARKNG